MLMINNIIKKAISLSSAGTAVITVTIISVRHVALMHQPLYKEVFEDENLLKSSKKVGSR